MTVIRSPLIMMAFIRLSCQGVFYTTLIGFVRERFWTSRKFPDFFQLKWNRTVSNNIIHIFDTANVLAFVCCFWKRKKNKIETKVNPQATGKLLKKAAINIFFEYLDLIYKTVDTQLFTIGVTECSWAGVRECNQMSFSLSRKFLDYSKWTYSRNEECSSLFKLIMLHRHRDCRSAVIGFFTSIKTNGTPQT